MLKAMTNDQLPMTIECPMTNDQWRLVIGHWPLVVLRPLLVSAVMVNSLVSAKPSALAQSNRVLTLTEAKQLMFQNNWDLLAARSEVDLATAQRIVAREFPNPTLSLASTKVSVDNHPASIGSRNDVWSRNYDTIAAINQLFEVGGKRSSRKASATAGFKAAEARLSDARRVVNLAVT